MASQLGTILRLQAVVLSQKSFAAAAGALASEVAMLFGCERASIGLLEHGYAKLVAVSGGSSFDPRQDAMARIAAAMEEAMEQGTLVALPRQGESRPQITQANAALLAERSGGVCSVPLVNRSEVVGALTLERARAPFSAAETTLCEHIAGLVGPVVAVKREADRTALQRALRGMRGFAVRLLEPGHRDQTRGIGGGAASARRYADPDPLPDRRSCEARRIDPASGRSACRRFSATGKRATR